MHEQALQHQRDSLDRIIAQKDNEINDMMTTMNDIVDGFRAISEAEQRVTVVRSPLRRSRLFRRLQPSVTP